MEGKEKLPKITQKNLGVDSVSRDNIEINTQKREILRADIDDLAYEIRKIGIEMANVTEDFPGDPKYQSALDSFAKMISERNELKERLQKAYDECIIASHISEVTDQSATTNSGLLKRTDNNLN